MSYGPSFGERLLSQSSPSSFLPSFQKTPSQTKPLPIAVSDIHLNDQQESSLTWNSRWDSVQKKCLNYCFCVQSMPLCGCMAGESNLSQSFFFKLLSFSNIIKDLLRRTMGLLYSHPIVLVLSTYLVAYGGQHNLWVKKLNCICAQRSYILSSTQ